MSIQPLAPPAREPVSVSDMKAYLRITHNDDTELITGFIRASREFVERYTDQVLIQRAFAWTLDAWPVGAKDGITLPRFPVQSITQIAVRARDGDWHPWATHAYRLEGERLIPAPGQSWPRPSSAHAGLKITFEAGYGPNAEDVPALFKHAIQLGVGALYADERAPETARRGAGQFTALKDWLRPLKRVAL